MTNRHFGGDEAMSGGALADWANREVPAGDRRRPVRRRARRCGVEPRQPGAGKGAAVGDLLNCPRERQSRLSLRRRPAGPSSSSRSSREFPRRFVRAAACLLGLLVGAGTVAAQSELPTVSISDVQVSEDATWMRFEVSLSAASADTVTVYVETSDGTATRKTDYRSESETLTFSPNSTSQVVLVLVYDDEELEEDETFTVTLTNPTGATLGDATATGTIKNDDTAATLAASDIGDTTAKLTIGSHTEGWWHRGQDLGNREWSDCTAVAAGTTAVDITGLRPAIGYDYRRTAIARAARNWPRLNSGPLRQRARRQ